MSQNGKDFYAVNVHATAFATDDTKQKHIDKYIEILNEINSSGDLFVSGGDLNSVPPGSEIDFAKLTGARARFAMVIIKTIQHITAHILATLKANQIS